MKQLSAIGIDKAEIITDNGYYIWSGESLMGRMFVQFVAFCYYEYLGEQIRQLKLSLGRENGDPAHDKKDTLDREDKLKSPFRDCSRPAHWKADSIFNFPSVDMSR